MKSDTLAQFLLADDAIKEMAAAFPWQLLELRKFLDARDVDSQPDEGGREAALAACAAARHAVEYAGFKVGQFTTPNPPPEHGVEIAAWYLGELVTIIDTKQWHGINTICNLREKCLGSIIPKEIT